MLNKTFKRLVNSFDNVDKESLSARKLTAFAFVIFIAYLHTQIAEENIIAMQSIDAIMVSVCLGLVTIPELLAKLTELKQIKE